MEKIIISGFADEISPDFDKQLQVVRELGMNHISLRSADGKGIADYTAEEFAGELLPRLDEAQIRISSMGSPIGKIPVDSEEEFEKQKVQLEEICKMCKMSGCRFVRMFSFYIPKDKNPDDYRESVIAKLREFEAIARNYDVILLHENEKGIYGDIARRCKVIFDEIRSPYLKAAFDFANFVQCGEDTKECWEMLKEHVVYIHIKDAVYSDHENVLCGTGDGNIEELLRQAICEEGYEGFLTLEPHLVLFDSLSSLETEEAENIIKKNKAKDGAEGYSMQYHALLEILNRIGLA